MPPLTPEELIDFEKLCDAEAMSLCEREIIIRDVFGPEAAAAYVFSRGKVLAFGGGSRLTGR